MGRTLFGADFDLAPPDLASTRFGADLKYPTLRVGPPFSLRVRVLTYPNPNSFTLTLTPPIRPSKTDEKSCGAK